MRKSIVAISTLLIGATSSTAFAGDAVVPPLLTRGMDPLKTLNMTSLVASELDFLGQFDTVNQLESKPAGFGGKCLSSASCLGGIASKSGASSLIAGAASDKGANVDIMLVYFDDGRIVRTKEFTVENSPSVVADSMSGFLRELVTGESIQQVQNRNTVAFDDTNDFDEEDDLFGGDTEDLFDGIAPIAAAEPVSRTIPTSSGSAPSELDELELDLLGDDLNDSAPARPAPEPELEDYQPLLAEDEPVRAEEEFVFEFASSADSVSDAEPGGIAAASTVESNRYDEYDEPARSTRYDEYDEPARSTRYDEYDEPSRSTRDDRDNRSARSDRDDRDRDRDRDSREDRYSDLDDNRRGGDSDRAQVDRDFSPARATLAGRVGRSNFQTLDFVTYGAEVSVSATDNIRVVAGIEPHSTKRDIPEALLEEGEPSTQWNTIVPLNAGLQYSFGESTWRPYLGGDVIVIPGYVSEVEGVTLEGGRNATGARVRGGLDILLADSFALNLNISYGRWSGKDFDAVQRDLADTGTVPQVSAGTVLRF